jgi:uncharacterized protein (DUF4213/DUF364 family)
LEEKTAWQLYDALIEGIPEEYVVDEMICDEMVLVRSGEGYGFSGVVPGDIKTLMIENKTPGMKLRDLAVAIKSWNYEEASIGQAAINAYYNSLPVARGNGVKISDRENFEDRVNAPFITYQRDIRGKKVAVIERFPYIDKLFKPVCALKVICRNPQPQGDEFPFPAAEYLLPDCEYVFIGCNTLIDKTMPRFLNLSRNAKVIIVGPPTPLAPVFSQFGVSDLSGFVIKDGEKARQFCSGKASCTIFSLGQKVALKLNPEC